MSVATTFAKSVKFADDTFKVLVVVELLVV